MAEDNMILNLNEDEVSSTNIKISTDLFLSDCENLLEFSTRHKTAAKAIVDMYVKSMEIESNRLESMEREIEKLEKDMSNMKEENSILERTNCILDDQILNLKIFKKKIKKCSIGFKKSPNDMDIVSCSNISFGFKITDDLSKGMFGKELVTIKKFNGGRKKRKAELSKFQELKHDSIMKISNYGFIEEAFYFVMENMDTTMDNYFANHCPQNRRVFTAVAKIAMRDMLLAIDYLHDNKNVIQSLSFSDILVDSINKPTRFKLHDLKCWESTDKLSRQTSLQIYGGFCHQVVSETNSVFLDKGCSDDAIARLLKDENDGKSILYYLHHPYLYTEHQMLLFNDLCSDELWKRKWFRNKKKFRNIKFKDGKSWINNLAADVKQTVLAINWRVENKLKRHKNERSYNGKEALQIRTFGRNFDHHEDDVISGEQYPQSDVDNTLRPFPDLLPVTYNGLLELEHPHLVNCRKLKFYFNIGQ